MAEGRVFINYRRSDSQGSAGRLFDRLLQHFERDQLFIDVDAIEPGVDFVDSLDKQVSNCSAFIAVIGPGWLTARNAAGERRLDNPSDYVRVEIESALKRDIRVIPVLVDGASMPPPSELPASLEPLSRRNAVEIAHHRFTTDCDALAVAIKRALGMAPPSATTPGTAAQTAAEPVMAQQTAVPLMAVPLMAASSVAQIDQAPAKELPPAKRSWAEILFSFRGRISRKQFVLGALAVVAIMFAVYMPINLLIDQLSSAVDQQTQAATKTLLALLDKRIGSIIEITVLWPTWALILKRLHDIGQGWMALLVVAALDVAATVLLLYDQDDLSFQVMLVYYGIVIMLAAIKGVEGPNRYGSDPLPPAKASQGMSRSL
jgi:uncharacterized membrane protein YhaH (DUF805 family)